MQLFSEIRSHLQYLLELAADGSEFVFSKLRRTVDQAATGWKAVNLRTAFTKIVRRAGFEPWPKLWHYLRASAETDLAERFPMHVVCKWPGHGRLIAQEHYLQVTDDHFVKAAGVGSRAAPALQQIAEKARKASQRNQALNEKPLVLRGVAASCEGMRRVRLGDTGFEPVTSTV